MESIKQLTEEDHKFEYGGVVMDACKVIILWNETAVSVPLAVRYETLAQSLSTACNKQFSDADAYIIMEKAAKMVGELKKRALGSAN